MAIDITVKAVSDALRIGSTAQETADITRLLGYATAYIQNALGSAYEDTASSILNEAAIRMIGYMYDSPTASRGQGFANLARNSGAAFILAPYIKRQAGIAGGAAAQAQSAPAPAPGGSFELTDQSILSRHIRDGAITTDKLDTGAVTDAKIANNTITAQKLTSDSIITDKIIDDAITEAKLDNTLLAKINAAHAPGAPASGQQWAASAIRALFHPWANVSSTAEIPIRFIPRLVDSKLPASNWIRTAMVQDGAITKAKLAADAQSGGGVRVSRATGSINGSADTEDSFWNNEADNANHWKVIGPVEFNPRLTFNNAISWSLINQGTTGDSEWKYLGGGGPYRFAYTPLLTSNPTAGNQTIKANRMPNDKVLHFGSINIGVHDDAGTNTRVWLQVRRNILSKGRTWFTVTVA